MFLYNIIFCIVLVLLKINCEQIIGNNGPAKVHHTLVQPLLHHAKTKKQITTTKYAEGLHHPEVEMVVDIDGEQHILDLRLNTDLVSGDHAIGYQKDGETILYKPSIKELDICQYSGKVRGKEGSWAALSTCHGVRGVIHDGKLTRYIEPAEGNYIHSKHYIYHHSDLHNKFSNYFDRDIDLIKEYSGKDIIIENTVTRHKRDLNEEEKILKGPFGANRDSRYLELVLVADNSVYNSSGRNITHVHNYLKDTANTVHALYAPLNIFVALVGVVVWNEKDEIELIQNNSETLGNFLKYRKEKILHIIPNDNAQLITNFKFLNAVNINDAFLRSICSENYSAGVNINMEGLGSIVAHTIGHNFGMKHDEPGCMCENKYCIMSPFLSTLPSTKWSYCSFIDLAKLFYLGLDYCLRNKPKSLFSDGCGNGFVDVGEQCDCGVDMWSPACIKCCDPNTCMFRHNATCSMGECCDTFTCQPKKYGVLCREAKKECDLPEYCNGHSEDCPEDVYKMDTTPCSDEQAYCVNGECRSHTGQCQILWGRSSKMAHSLCYSTYNDVGDKFGCGYHDVRNEKSKKYHCSPEDALCGLLHCQFKSNSTPLREEPALEINYKYVDGKDSNLSCISTTKLKQSMSDMLLGLVPDGAKCGEDKMCLQQKCVSIAPIRENITKLESSICPSDCFGHGVCNSKGHCHCDVGFVPPNCVSSVVGGSLDSGPVIINGQELKTEKYFRPQCSSRRREVSKLSTEIKPNEGILREMPLLTIMLSLLIIFLYDDVITIL